MIVLDFETKDPYISLGLGAGWVYPLHVPSSTFRALGYAVLDTDTLETGYYKANKADLEALLKKHPQVIMHNAQYDLGCLLSLGVSIDNLEVYDTKIVAQLYDNTLRSYSLESLSQLYLIDEIRKDKNLLVEAAIRLNLAPHLKRSNKTFTREITKWCYENMDTLHEVAWDEVAAYAIQDVSATYGLYEIFSGHVPRNQALKYSAYQKLCVYMRAKGVRIDMVKVQEGIDSLSAELVEADRKVREILPIPAAESLLSNPSVVKGLKLLGVSLGLTKTGGDSASKEVLENSDHPACKELLHYRTIHKLLNDYFIKPRNMQIYCCPEAAAGTKWGRLFPELNLFGAETGRFSSSNPNIQQIPKRNKTWAKLCRSIFIPDNPANQWISSDWSNQEGRLQLHYAAKLNLPGAAQMAAKFKENPKTDMHGEVAALAGIERPLAKTINLGLSYGMGEGKLCRALGLPTVKKKLSWGTTDIAGPAAAAVLSKYHKAIPYAKKLAEETKKAIRSNGSIRTMGGRHLRLDGPRFDYKALNKLIQGSAADQCLDALQKAFDAGLDVKFPVHDEINIEGGKSDAHKLQLIMEDSENLLVPMIAEVSIGNNWGDLHEYTP